MREKAKKSSQSSVGECWLAAWQSSCNFVFVTVVKRTRWPQFCFCCWKSTKEHLTIAYEEQKSCQPTRLII